VAPTPAAITAAGALGDGVPLYGLNDDASGAYPFTWVDSLFVPATGLSVDKTNAIATFLRYATGPGRSLAAGVGDGSLPDSLASQAAAKANDIVTGNCAAAGGTTRNDPSGGPDWPTGVPAPAGGALICVAAPIATTTTVASSASSGSVLPSVDGSSGFGATAFSSSPISSSVGGSPGALGSSGEASASESDGTTDATNSTGAASSDGSTATGSSGFTATTTRVDLPLKPPDDGEFALDRFTTILLGGLFFLVIRSLIAPRLKSL
jgi:hypothetical protein